MPLLRLSKAVAVLAALGCIALWIRFIWLLPYARSHQPASRLIAFLMIALWAAAMVVVIRHMFLGAYAAVVVAFFPIGLYLLATPSEFLWIGVLTLVYLVATLALHRVSSTQQHR